jgi:predicted MFS family arabinose efflux permease
LSSARPHDATRFIVFLVGAVQFVNILDFMMVSPLGPDFAEGLGIPNASIGWIVGSYTVAAAVAGLAGSFFLDRFDRRPALVVAMLGLALGTLAGAFATGLDSLMAARCLAGLFGGPATSLALSIVADVVPAERRGRALGAVAGAFSIASIAGVPAGLELARRGGWRFPFVAVAVVGVLITIGGALRLPSLRGHLKERGARPTSLAELLTRPTVLASYSMTAVIMMAGFCVLPNIPAYVQKNLGYPRDTFALLYLAGGVCSFFAMRLAGTAVDQLGSTVVGSVASALVAGLVWLFFIAAPPWLPVVGIFIGFMSVMAFRNVAYNTLTSKVAAPGERARFMSIQSTVQHLASGLGAGLASEILATRADGSLVHLDRVAWLSIALSALLPPLFYTVERRVTAAATAPVPDPST